MDPRELIPLVVGVLCAVACSQAQTPSNKASVRLSAIVQDMPPSITLQWAAHSGANSYNIYRRTPGSLSWGSTIASLSGSALQYVDNNVAVGQEYEYKVRRSGNGTGYGYLRSGIEVPPVHVQGKVILLVEEQLANALVFEIEHLIADMNADGWVVLRHNVNSAATPQSVRDTVIADHQADPANVKSVFILGHVPVARSGSFRPDGHTDHHGAWSCDAYYGELTSNWTDANVTTTSASYAMNHNVPGDGKFDHSDLPSNVELAVGRVDMSGLTLFGQSETDLTRAYLQKAREFKTRLFEPAQRGIFFDDLYWVSNSLGASGPMSISTCVGQGRIDEPSPSALPFSNLIGGNYLWSYHSGNGAQGVHNNQTIFDGIANQIRVSDLIQVQAGTVFNMSFGSYFGDWDNENNYLRALLASGRVLTNVWSGIPNWYFHPMAMGEPIGNCATLSMNNTNSNYSLQNGGWQGQNYSRSHMSLMGDPTLRMKYVQLPSDLVATDSTWYTWLTWSASPDTVIGYHCYKFDDVNGEIIRLTQDMITDTSFLSNIQFFPGDRYMVRAVKLEVSPSGSYHNLSLGDIAVAAGNQTADCAGVIGGASIPGAPCDDGDPDTGDDTYDENCQCIGLPLDCAGVPNGTALPGTPCDDGNPQTIDDLYDANCICIGITINGVRELDQGRLIVAPNPANERLFINADGPLNGSVQLYSSTGQLMLEQKITGQGASVMIDRIPNGPYLLLYAPLDQQEKKALTRVQVMH